MRRRTSLATLGAFALTGAPAFARRPTPAPSPSPSPVPTPTPSPTPLPESERLERLHGQLGAVSASAPGRLGIAVIDGRQFTRYAARGDEAFGLANLVNVPIAVLAYRRSDQKRLDLDARVEVLPQDLRHGVGPIAEAHPHGGVSFTYAELVRAMLIAGDATASDLVLKAVGGPKGVDDFLSRGGFAGFDVRKSERDRSADVLAGRTFAQGGDNGGTPNGFASLLFAIANADVLHIDSATEILELMSASHAGETRLRAGLPPGAELAHAIGTGTTSGGIADVTNDAGILTLPDGRRVVIAAFLSASNADLPTREATLAKVARTVYDAYLP